MPGSFDVLQIRSLTALQSVHVKRGEQWQQALDLFVAEQGVELLRDVSTCNASISACEKREEWQQALGLPGSLDVFPNSVTYSAAVSACEKRGAMKSGIIFVP